MAFSRIVSLVILIAACGADDGGDPDPAECTADCGSWCAEPGTCPNPGCLCPAPVGEIPCGDETCDPSEVCVSCNCGGPTSFACEPAPSDCASDRSCACLANSLCPEIASDCVDQGENHILCDSGLD
jgi:hypothetical protein